MLRCPNIECRQQEQGFVMRGQKLRMYFKDNNFEIKFNGDLNEKLSGDKDYFKKNYGKYKMKCNKCNHSATANEFVNAYEDPMKYFDTSNLCSCGGEFWNDIEYIKPKQTLVEIEWNGNQGQRQVASEIKHTTRCDKCGKIIK